MRGTVIFN